MNYETMQIVNKGIKQETANIASEMEKIMSEISKLSTAWVGIDSQKFCEEVASYMNQAKKTPETLSTLSSMLDKVMYTYHDKDSNWKNQMKREVTQNEQ